MGMFKKFLSTKLNQNPWSIKTSKMRHQETFTCEHLSLKVAIIEALL